MQLGQDLADQIRIGLPLGNFHDLSFQEVDRLNLSRPGKIFHGFWIGGNHL